MILRSWHEISGVCSAIYLQRKQFFEERKKFENKQIKLTKLMTKLEEDSYIFTIPAKFPEAYHRTIQELQRRKIYNEAISKVCILMHRVTK